MNKSEAAHFVARPCASDAGGARGLVAADEAEAVGQQRQAEHRVRVVREGAQDGAVVDVEELDGLVVRAGERVLVVGQRHEGVTVLVCSSKVFWRVPSRSHTRTVLSSPAAEDALAVGHRRHRQTKPVCPAQVLTRLLVATLHTLTSLSSEPLMMCWPSGVTATAFTESVCPLKVWTSVPSTWYSRTSPCWGRRGRPQSARRRAAPRRRARCCPPRRCARARRRR